jgi:CRISPR/Cas system-associated exonuclease Cas4 (RecB family)
MLKQFIEGRPLSATNMKTFASCPRRFYYKMTGVPEEYIGNQLLLGGALHSAAETFFRNKNYPVQVVVGNFILDYESRYDAYKQAGQKVFYRSGSPRKDKAEGAGMLEGFCEEYRSLPCVEPECEMIADVTIDGYTVRLYAGIDVVVEDADYFGIYDIKSGKSAPTDIYLKHDMQLGQYAYVFRHGSFCTLDKQTKQLTSRKALFDPLSKPLKYKGIYNIRGYLKQPFTSHQVEFRTEEFDEDNFLLTLHALIKEMELYSQINYWPKRGIGSVHDCSCAYCSYKEKCQGEV